MSSKKTTITKESANHKLFVTREFDAPIELVWKAWTEHQILDSWWAPRPWKAKTKSLDFRPGGVWLYAMMGPKGEENWCRAEYQSIDPVKNFLMQESFCDENGIVNNEFPGMHWKTDFFSEGSQTKVVVEITFESEADLNKIVEMGFEEGFTAAHGNLDEIFAK